MKRLSLLTIGLFSATIAVSQVHAQTIDFAALKSKGGQKSNSACVLLDDKGTIATVVELGSDPQNATLVLGRP